jgi:hypothetical protein
MRAAAYALATGSLVAGRAKFDSERSGRPVQSAPPTVSSEGAGTDSVGLSLELSQSRTYDAALAILRAHKLTGNFTTEVEVVLRDLGVLNEVTYEVEEPKSLFSDIRRVVFRVNGNVDAKRFREITRLVHRRIGSRPLRPWWMNIFRQL